MDEDRLKDLYDRESTHDDPHSPYYDGPDELDCCEHGIGFDEECEDCEDEEE